MSQDTLDRLKDKFDNFLRHRVEKIERVESTIHYGGALIGYLILSAIFKNENGISKTEFALYLFGFIGYIIILSNICGSLQRLYKDYKKSDAMKIRYALVSTRELSTYLSQIFSDMGDRVQTDPQYKLKFSYMVRRLKFILARMVFNQISFGNTNLDIRYRIALFEPKADLDETGHLSETLKGVAFYNSERERPKIFSLDYGYKECEGVAGWAWHYRRPFCISNVRECLEMMEQGQLDRPVFKTNFPKSQDTPMRQTPLSCKSVICYPVIINKLGGESVKAVLSIDCDMENHISADTEYQAKMLRIQLYPYVRLYALLYGVIDLLEACSVPDEAKSNTVAEADVDRNDSGIDDL